MAGRYPQEYRNNLSSSSVDASSGLSASAESFFKTRYCKFFDKGLCWKGNECQFAHYGEELRCAPDLSKTRMCIRNRRGLCPRSKEECGFAHSLAELRSTNDLYKTDICVFWMTGHCRAGPACRHAHGDSELRERQAGSAVTTSPVLPQLLAAARLRLEQETNKLRAELEAENASFNQSVNKTPICDYHDSSFSRTPDTAASLEGVQTSVSCTTQLAYEDFNTKSDRDSEADRRIPATRQIDFGMTNGVVKMGQKEEGTFMPAWESNHHESEKSREEPQRSDKFEDNPDEEPFDKMSSSDLESPTHDLEEWNRETYSERYSLFCDENGNMISVWNGTSLDDENGAVVVGVEVGSNLDPSDFQLLYPNLQPRVISGSEDNDTVTHPDDKDTEDNNETEDKKTDDKRASDGSGPRLVLLSRRVSESKNVNSCMSPVEYNVATPSATCRPRFVTSYLFSPAAAAVDGIAICCTPKYPSNDVTASHFVFPKVKSENEVRAAL